MDGENGTDLNLGHIHTQYVESITGQNVDPKPWITFSNNIFSHTGGVAVELAMMVAGPD